MSGWVLFTLSTTDSLSFPLKLVLLSSDQTLLPSPVPLFMTLSFVIPPSSPPFQHERLRGGSVRIKLSSADGENINQVMHIRQTSVREEGRNMFTRFLLIALSMFPRLFRHPVFIHHSTAEVVLECPLSAQVPFPVYLFLRISLAFSCLLSVPIHTTLFIFILGTESKFGMTWRWINEEFWVNYPFKTRQVRYEDWLIPEGCEWHNNLSWRKN